MTCWRAAQPSSNTTTGGSESLPPLLRLPAELRNKIWKLAVFGDLEGYRSSIEIRSTTRRSICHIPKPPLLFTCKTVRSEAIGLYYDANKIVIYVVNFDPAPCLLLGRKLQTLFDCYGIDLRSKPIEVSSCRFEWKDLKRWLRLRYDGVDTTNIGMSSAVANREAGPMKAAIAMINMVSRMRSTPWEEVQQILYLMARASDIATRFEDA